MIEKDQHINIGKIWNIKNGIKYDPKKVKRTVSLAFNCELTDGAIEKLMIMQKNDLIIMVEIYTPQKDLPLVDGKGAEK